MDPVTGKKGGVLYDYMEYAEDCLGNQHLDFEPIEMESCAALTEALQTGKIDMIFCASSNPNAGEEKGIASQLPHGHTISSPLPKKSLLRRRRRIAWRCCKMICRSSGILSIIIHSGRSSRAGLRRAEKTVRGRVNCLLTGACKVKYTERNALYSTPLSRPLKISFGVKSGQPQLLSVLNKTLKAMPIGMLSSSFSMHENAENKVTLKTIS